MAFRPGLVESLSVRESSFTSWMWSGAVAFLALVLRLVNLASPTKVVFDEIYYAKDAHDLLIYGVEQNKEGTGPGFVAHPPLGKWCIAVGERIFGYNSFGWRIVPALAGALTVLVLVRVARRLFGSLLLGCTAGLLLAVDGLHFVMSRVALLDVFLALFVLMAFACLLLDRDARRGRLADGRRPQAWWRLASGAFLGLALGVKWSALWFLAAFLLLAFLWDVGARRALGSGKPVRESLLGGVGLVLIVVVPAVVVYLATWTGWFLRDDGWGRNWAAQPGNGVPFVPAALVSLWHYHQQIYSYHLTVTIDKPSTDHAYQSTPWSWLFAGRPVLYFREIGHGFCGASECRREIVGLGTPLLWWSFVPALLMTAWGWLARRDWRAVTILLCFAAGWVPWLLYPERTMFYFYALPALPFLVLAVTYGLGAILGSAPAPDGRRRTGAIVVALYVAVIALNFLYFFPIYTGGELTQAQWLHRLWFDSWN